MRTTTRTDNPGTTRRAKRCGCPDDSHDDCGCGCGGNDGCGCGGASAEPACDACGGAAASGFVRPRFFAGQLLNESDLGQMMDYVVAKNRLHNRNFMGEGVVCGLLARAGDAAAGGKVGTVLVCPGHALDCCGNDIVLPCEYAVDIRALRQRLVEKNCKDCGDAVDPAAVAASKDKANELPLRCYDLYVYYCESEVDPVTPYYSDGSCDNGCENTRTQEGFRFELRCASDKVVGATLMGSLSDAAAGGLPGKDATKGEQVAFKAQFLAEQLNDGCITDPVLIKALNRNELIGLLTDPDSAKLMDEKILGPLDKSLQEIVVRVRTKAVCDSLLVPCAPCNDLGVRVARVSMRDCDIVSVCNSVRRQIVTPAAVRYWASTELARLWLTEQCCPNACGPGKGRAPAANVAAVLSSEGEQKRVAALFAGSPLEKWSPAAWLRGLMGIESPLVVTDKIKPARGVNL